MNRKNGYRNLDLWRDTCNRQKKRYYDKTAIYSRSSWSEAEDVLVLKHTIPDMELSAVICRSVNAIQKRRWYLKKVKEELSYAR